MDPFVTKILEQSLPLGFAVIAVITLFRMYVAEKTYNRERDKKQVEVLAQLIEVVKLRLEQQKEDMKNLRSDIEKLQK
ncbi:MAG: hypothetical protein KDD28_26945 [Phaeodactylibacter sp.]|nr:hypothetical protein [Phaeodactylibacter sp.]